MANVLSPTQREFIVRKLAAFDFPRAIVIDFAAQFPGSKCDENDVKRLDPVAGAILSPELHTVFVAAREYVYLNPEDAGPYIKQLARLLGLNKQAEMYVGNNQLAEARAVWRQMAEEQGIVGGKGTAKTKDADKPEPIRAITRTIIHPKTTEETDGEGHGVQEGGSEHSEA